MRSVEWEWKTCLLETASLKRPDLGQVRASLQLGRNIPFPFCPEPQRKSEMTVQGDWDTDISGPC